MKEIHSTMNLKLVNSKTYWKAINSTSYYKVNWLVIYKKLFEINQKQFSFTDLKNELVILINSWVKLQVKWNEN